MKKHKVFGYILILLGVFAVVIGVMNSDQIVSEEDALLVVEDYIKNNQIVIDGENYNSRIAISKDGYSLVRRTQEWIVLINDSESTWIYIDAYGGGINKIEKYENEPFYILPKGFTEFQLYYSWVLVLNYLIVVLSLFYNGVSKKIKAILHISFLHLIISIIFYEIVSYIYMILLMFIIGSIYSIYDKILAISIAMGT